MKARDQDPVEVPAEERWVETLLPIPPKALCAISHAIPGHTPVLWKRFSGDSSSLPNLPPEEGCMDGVASVHSLNLNLCIEGCYIQDTIQCASIWMYY